MTNDDTTNRRAAIDLLKRGELSLSDVAKLAGVDRQLVYYWAKTAGIESSKAYDARIKSLWARAVKRNA